jgi:hypothetical protein
MRQQFTVLGEVLFQGSFFARHLGESMGQIHG